MQSSKVKDKNGTIHDIVDSRISDTDITAWDKTKTADGVSDMLNTLNNDSVEVTDFTHVALQENTSKGFIRSSVAYIWTYIKSKISDWLGISTDDSSNVILNKSLKVNGSEDVATLRYLNTYYEQKFEVGQGLELTQTEDDTRVVRIKTWKSDGAQFAPYHPTGGWRTVNMNFDHMGRMSMFGTLQTMPIPLGFGTLGQVLVSQGDSAIPTWNDISSLSFPQLSKISYDVTTSMSLSTLLLARMKAGSSRLYIDWNIVVNGNGSNCSFKIIANLAKSSSNSLFQADVITIPFRSGFTPTIKAYLNSDNTLDLFVTNMVTGAFNVHVYKIKEETENIVGTTPTCTETSGSEKSINVRNV